MSDPTYCYGNETYFNRGRVKYYEIRNEVIDRIDHQDYTVRRDQYVITDLSIQALHDPDEDIAFSLLNMQCHFEVFREASEQSLNGSLSLQLAGIDSRGQVLWAGNINYSGVSEPDYIWQSVLTPSNAFENTTKIAIASIVYLTRDE